MLKLLFYFYSKMLVKLLLTELNQLFLILPKLQSSVSPPPAAPTHCCSLFQLLEPLH